MSDFRLKVFYSVARNQSFTRAAKELFVSQPAITKHINELERQYSVRLFDRTGGKIMLTDAGRLLLEHCSAYSTSTTVWSMTWACSTRAAADI